MDNLGAIVPGYVTDMLLMDSLSELRPSQVYFEGTLISENGALVAAIEEKSFELEPKNSVNLQIPILEQFIYMVLTPEKMKRVMREIGLNELDNPLLRIAICALPVIPERKMSDLGLVDVLNKKLIPLYLI